MRVRLLTSMKFRVPGEGSKYLSPGIYDTTSPDFPEALRGESRIGVVEFLDGPVPPAPSEENTETADAYDEPNDDIGEEVVEEKKPGRPKKETIKRRG